MTVRDTCHRAAAIAVMQISLLAPLLPAQSGPLPDQTAVRTAVIPLVNDGTIRGIALGWSERGAFRSTGVGAVFARGAAVDAATRFDLGDAGEVLTAALLANLVARGEVSLDDLAQQFLPPTVVLPHRAGRAITLGDLAFHRSGLPNLRPRTARSPTEGIAQALNGTALRFDIGSRYAFSQLGIDILGLALAHHLRAPLTDAIRRRILAPLGVVDIVPADARRFAGRDAIGHADTGVALATSSRTAGAWRGSVDGVLRFVTAASDTVNGPLASTFALMMRTRSLGPDPALPVALGWRVLRVDGRDIYWHDAQDAPGFSDYFALDPSRGRAVAVLSNTAKPVDAIAGALLLGRVPAVTRASRSASRAAPAHARPPHRRPGRR